MDIYFTFLDLSASDGPGRFVIRWFLWTTTKTLLYEKKHHLQANFYATSYITDHEIRIPWVSQNVAQTGLW